MSTKQVIEFIDEPKKSFGFNTKSLVAIESDSTPQPTKKRGPGRPPKDSSSIANVYTDPNSFIKADKKLTPEKQYEKGYSATIGLLGSAIQQADQIYNNIETELNNYRNNRSYGGRSRMVTMSEFMNTQMGLINTKINAIRELDNIKHKVNDLVLKRMQFDKEVADENSDKTVMDAYYALVNSAQYGLTPMQSPLSPASINTGINMSGTPLSGSFISDASNIIPANPEDKLVQQDSSFNDYKANLTPIQRKMILDNDPNIKTVVVYDQGSGRKYFDVVNVQTGQSVPGVTRPAEFLLDNMRIDARNGIASNSNVNQTYPLVITGTRIADEL